jgi:hypothetical protein
MFNGARQDLLRQLLADEIKIYREELANSNKKDD